MQFVGKFIRFAVVGMFVSMAVALTSGAPHVGAAEKSPKQEASTKDKSRDDESTVMYSYTANSGDTYTQLVRKAVQTYGITHDEDVGVGRIIAIETRVAEQSGWPVLNEGQAVSFSEGLVKAWIDEATQLSDADLAAWATYAPYIDFDTRGIGE